MRRYCSRWTAAEVALAVAWAAAATGLLADALARESVGSALTAAFCAWQMSHVWYGVHAREMPAPDSRRAFGRPR